MIMDKHHLSQGAMATAQRGHGFRRDAFNLIEAIPAR